MDTKSFGVSVAALLASRRAGGTTVASGFRYSSDTTGNSISSFGQFQFGVTSSMGIDNSLSTMTLGNPTLTTALTLGTNTSPLTSSLPVLTAAAKSAYSGLNGATIDAIRPQISNVSTGYGTASATLTKSLLAAQAINSSKISKAPVNTDGKIINSSGRVILPAESYGVINATQTGTAQFGFNTNTSPDGFLGPCGTQLPPPYLSNAPYGIDVGRFVPAPSNVPLE